VSKRAVQLDLMMGDYWDFYLVLEMEQRMVPYLVLMTVFLIRMVMHLVNHWVSKME